MIFEIQKDDLITFRKRCFGIRWYTKRQLPKDSVRMVICNVIQNDILLPFFKHLLKRIVVNVKIQSKLVGHFLFPDMLLVIRYSCR